MIQDYVIAAVQVVFALSLLPSMLNVKTRIPLPTSLLTGAGLFVIAMCFLSLSLWVSAATSFITSAQWFSIAYFRSKPVPE